MSKVYLIPCNAHQRLQLNASQNAHKHYNELLNQLKISSSQPGYVSTPLQYAHRYLVDSFYPTDSREKIRVTRDEKTGEVVECVRKIRLKDLNVYSPKRTADWRVSVNLEVPGECFFHLGRVQCTWILMRGLHTVPQPVGTPTHTRRKDRISYSHEEFSIDLTQVTSTGPGGAVRSACAFSSF
jgi:hypothetical protein